MDLPFQMWLSNRAGLMIHMLTLGVFLSTATYLDISIRSDDWNWMNYLQVQFLFESYCWWKKSCTTWHVQNPGKNGIFTISTDAGFYPSSVCAIGLIPLVSLAWGVELFRTVSSDGGKFADFCWETQVWENGDKMGGIP